MTGRSDWVLLDTDVFSFLIRENDSRGAAYEKYILGKLTAITLISLGELRFWMLRRHWNERRVEALASRLATVLVIPLDRETCDAYAAIKHEAKNEDGSDRVVADNDLWIAASARRHGVPLLSHNRRHFENLPGIVLISEA